MRNHSSRQNPKIQQNREDKKNKPELGTKKSISQTIQPVFRIKWVHPNYNQKHREQLSGAAGKKMRGQFRESVGRLIGNRWLIVDTHPELVSTSCKSVENRCRTLVVMRWGLIGQKTHFFAYNPVWVLVRAGYQKCHEFFVWGRIYHRATQMLPPQRLEKTGKSGLQKLQCLVIVA